MRIKEFQEQSNLTDQVTGVEIQAKLTPVLGLVGRVGALSTDYMRYLRDGDAYSESFRREVGAALGDLMWYIANIAKKNEIDLEQVARENIEKNHLRWVKSQEYPDFDSLFDRHERLPRDFEIFLDINEKGGASLEFMGNPFGDFLTDNSEVEDGYRFHDIFHLAFVSHLGWSPVLRGKKFFNCKRKSNRLIDEVEDGGRAAVIEEAVSALIFNESKKFADDKEVSYVGQGLLKLIAQLTSHLEVKECTHTQWEKAILNALDVWRSVKKNPKGVFVGSRDQRVLNFIPS